MISCCHAVAWSPTRVARALAIGVRSRIGVVSRLSLRGLSERSWPHGRICHHRHGWCFLRPQRTSVLSQPQGNPLLQGEVSELARVTRRIDTILSLPNTFLNTILLMKSLLKIGSWIYIAWVLTRQACNLNLSARFDGINQVLHVGSLEVLKVLNADVLKAL